VLVRDAVCPDVEQEERFGFATEERRLVDDP
jgi:hypothetical protein